VDSFKVTRPKKRFSSSSTAEDNNNNIISTRSSKKFDIFANKPFWISNIESHKAEDRRTKTEQETDKFLEEHQRIRFIRTNYIDQNFQCRS
jgi:hypothetical protein